MKSFVITNDRDVLLAFKLSGIVGELTSEENALDTLETVLKDDEIMIILLTENIMNKFSTEIGVLSKRYKRKLITQIPDSSGLHDKDFLVRNIKESIGIKI